MIRGRTLVQLTAGQLEHMGVDDADERGQLLQLILRSAHVCLAVRDCCRLRLQRELARIDALQAASPSIATRKPSGA